MVLEGSFNITAEYIDSKNIWEPSEFDEKSTLNSVLSLYQIDKMSDVQRKAFKTIFEEGENFDNQIDYSYKLSFMSQFRLNALARSQKYKKEMFVFYDDVGIDVMNPLYEYNKYNEKLGELVVDNEYLRKTLVNNNCYFIRPDKYDPFNNWISGTTVIGTTTEKTVMQVFKLIHPDGVILNLYDGISNNSVSYPNITFVSSDKTTCKYDGMLPLLSESVLEEWDHELIGDGMGLKANYSTMRGRNDMATKHIVVECSFPAKNKLQELIDVIHYHSTDSEKQSNERQLVVNLMKDEIEQALGRNQGYRDEGMGCEAIVLINKNYYSDVIESFNFRYGSQEIQNLSKIEVCHPFLIALKNFDSFIASGDYEKWQEPALERAADREKMKRRLDAAIRNRKVRSVKRKASRLMKRIEKFQLAREKFHEVGIRKVVKKSLNLRRWYFNDEIQRMFLDFEDPNIPAGFIPLWVAKPPKLP